MKCKVAALLFASCLVTSCASTPTTQPFAEPIPSVGKIDRFFVVLVTEDKDAPGGCKIDVRPKGPSEADPNDVKVKHNWRVAWFVVNTCKAKVGVTPSIVFALASDVTKIRRPVNFTDTSPDFLIAKVKNKPRDCTDTNEQAACTLFKYTIHFGDSFEDPDIEIVM